MNTRDAWIADENQVLVVAAGKGAREQAHRFGVYHSQNGRSFRASKYIAFYSGGSIDTVAVIDGPPEDDVVIADRPEYAELAKHMSQNNGNPREPHRVLRLKDVRKVGPIRNDMVSKSGGGTAYVQRQRYTSIGSLRSVKKTSELEAL